MSIDTSRFNKAFYDQQWRRETARIILTEIFNILPQINSAVDFGCGGGAWLAVIKSMGISEIKGYDGNWVPKEALQIPKECFVEADLSKKISVLERYDIAISIEVAEHLSEKAAKIFVETLTSASDIVLFSAAIPHQGGIGHINEQWQNYWYDLFNEFGYIGIDIRSLIWNDNRAGYLQRQNIMLYVKKEKANEIKYPHSCQEIICKYINFVHPEVYLRRDVEAISIFRLYKIAVRRTIKKIFGEKTFEFFKKIFKQKNGI